MEIALSYGKKGLVIQIPDDNHVGTLTFKGSDALLNPSQEIERAISSPIGTLPLAQIAAGKQSAVIVVCDLTRPVPNAIILPPILALLKAAEIPIERTEILIATGTHRGNTPEELDLMLSPEIARSYPVINHICTQDEVMRWVGTSPNGVPVWLNQHYLDAELKITIGMIEPHFMAGFAGGRKMVMPGVAKLETVQAWHSPKFLEHPNATNGILVGNPTHEEALAITKMAPPDFICDVVLDKEKKITAVFAGHFESAWLEGTHLVRASVTAELPEPADIVVTSSGGFPLDLTFYQTVKGMVGAMPVVKSGGTIIIASECKEGVGNKHFLDCLLSLAEIESFAERIESPGWQFVPDQWQVEELSKAVRHANIVLVTDGIPPDLVPRLHVESAPSIEVAVEDALKRHGPKATIAVIPQGPYVLATCTNQAG